MLLLLIGCSTVNKNVIAYKEAKEIQTDHPKERDEWEYNRIKDPVTGEVPTQNLINVYNSYLAKEEDHQQIAISNVEWEERGPTNIGGRT